MLYEHWLEIARENAGEIALYDISCGRRWTFAQLKEEAEKGDKATDLISFPQGITFHFILTILRAWRDKKIVCPIESGQSKPVFTSPPESCVHLKITSATTGAARAIAFKSEQLVADVENIVATMGLRRDWPNLGVISLAHSYGFSNLVLPLLLHGIPLILVDSPLPEIVRKAVGSFENLTLAAVPALWRAWRDADAITSNVRLAISAGAPLPLNLEEDIFTKTGIKVHNFYGSSECGGIAYDSSNRPRTDASCAGGAMKNVQLTVAENGCLEIRSRAVAETYWPEPSDNLANGCFRASDLTELRDGLVFLRGRASDQINVAGRKVSPELIERILLTHPNVSDCLLFGVPTTEGERTEKIVACVVGKSDCYPDVLKQFLLNKIPAWQIPRDWWFVDSLAVNQRGKLSRVEWRKRYQERGA